MATAETVTVACRLPTGLVCDVVDMESFKAAIPRMEARQPYHVARKGRFRLRGYQEARRADSAGTIETEARNVIGGYGLTSNVPKDLWEEWLAQNADYPPVKNGLIFAHTQRRSAETYATEHAELKSGFDALNPENPDGKAKEAQGLRIKPENYQGMPPIKD